MQFYTASWFTYHGPGRVGISRGSPRRMTAGYKFYKPLAPSWDLVKTAKTIWDYRPRYEEEVLSGLDPYQVISDLEKLGQEDKVVMLCFERPPLNDVNFCHRTMVAEWLTEKTGLVVEEWSGLAETNRRS